MRAAPLPPICILAGGLGTRLGSKVRDTPKPLLEVAGEPFILHQLRLLASYGAEHAVICVGYLGEQIVEQVGAQRFGITIRYSHDGDQPLGTLGAIRQATPMLGTSFLVLYGDTYLRIDYRAAVAAWHASGLPAMMTVLRNDGRWDTSNTVFDGQLVSVYDKRSPTPEMNWIDYGLGGLQARALGLVEQHVADLSDLYHELARNHQLFGFEAHKRFYEIGTPEALASTTAFLAQLSAREPGGAPPQR
ncbi:MAG: sugar phosphate nucleotidyltransferase [Solirubrobacteraceae bacterium]